MKAWCSMCVKTGWWSQRRGNITHHEGEVLWMCEHQRTCHFCAITILIMARLVHEWIFLIFMTLMGLRRMDRVFLLCYQCLLDKPEDPRLLVTALGVGCQAL